MPRHVDQWPALIDGGLNKLSQAGRLALQMQLGAGDPRDIDQVVDQAGELIELLRHHADELADLLVVFRFGGDQLNCGG